MKKIVFLTLLMVLSFQTSNSQNKNEKDLITSGKWYVEYVIMNEQKMDLPPEVQKATWAIFHKDGKYEGIMNQKKRTGNWELEKEVLKIIFSNKEEDESKLISVTKDRMVFSSKDEEGIETILGMKK